MDLIDLMTGMQDSVVAVLEAFVPPEVATTGTHLLQDQPLDVPFFLIDAIDMEYTGAKFEQAERLTLDIAVIYRGTDRQQLLSAMHFARGVLDRQPLEHPDIDFQQPRCIAASASGVAGDGVTYAGVLTFIIDAEPA